MLSLEDKICIDSNEVCCDNIKLLGNVCVNCGMIHEEVICFDDFTNNEPKSSIGDGPETLIGNDKELKNNYKYSRLNKINLTNKTESRLRKSILNFNIITEQLGLLGEERTVGWLIYKHMLDQPAEEKMLVGTESNTLISAIVYHACRAVNKYMTMDNLISSLSLNSKHFKSCLKRLDERVIPELIKKYPHYDFSVNFDSSPAEIVTQCSGKLGITGEIFNLANKIAKNYKSSKTPQGIAAAAIYYACKEFKFNLSQDYVAEIIGTSSNTLRQHYKKLLLIKERNSNRISAKA